MQIFMEGASDSATAIKGNTRTARAWNHSSESSIHKLLLTRQTA